ncbi:MAG: RNA 2',3'-cyclic phosphodiesterase [Nanoarchaeota archaeon]|nr:RNA 2',3'-cyclic phosphodiesterase [Nanoarchaeota archaeon]
MKLFIAVDASAEVKDYLYDFQKRLKKDYAKIAWVPKKNLHVTLKFLGEVEEGKLDLLKNALKEVKFNAFKLRLGNIGFFPDVKRPRVIWVGLEPEEPLIALQQKVDEALLTMFSGEQTFKCHLTLGRVKALKKPIEFIKNAQEVKVEAKEFLVDSFKLMKSELKNASPIYTSLEEFKGDSQP